MVGTVLWWIGMFRPSTAIVESKKYDYRSVLKFDPGIHIEWAHGFSKVPPIIMADSSDDVLRNWKFAGLGLGIEVSKMDVRTAALQSNLCECPDSVLVSNSSLRHPPRPLALPSHPPPHQARPLRRLRLQPQRHHRGGAE